MVTETQVVVYRVDASGETGERAGTGVLIGPLFVLIHPPLSLQLAQLADQPDETKLRLGIGSFSDDSRLTEVIDVSGIDVYQHGEQTLVAAGLARPSAAPFGPDLRNGAESSKEDLALALLSYLRETTPPGDIEPGNPPGRGRGPERISIWCKLFPRLCHKPKKK